MTKIEKERAFFNERAATWDQKVVHDPKKITAILATIEIKEGDRILDVGCGTGVLSPYLLKLIGEQGSILSMDLAEEMIRIAKKKRNHPQVEYRRGNVLEDLGEEIFDQIICYSMFPHFEKKKEAIGQLTKHLKPGGTLTIAHSNSRDGINGMHGEQTGTTVKEDRLPTAEMLISYGEEAGLERAQVIDNSECFLVSFKQK